METITKNEEVRELMEFLSMNEIQGNPALELTGESAPRFLRDLKMNLKTVLNAEHLSRKESLLLAVAVAANENNGVLLQRFAELAKREAISNEESAEAIACASLLSSNNVLYRFRHFTKKEKYQQLPARLRMNLMMNPVLGKELFELISLAVSAVNGCEMCVNAHEHSLIGMQVKEEKIFDAIRVAATVVSVSKIIR